MAAQLRLSISSSSFTHLHAVASRFLIQVNTLASKRHIVPMASDGESALACIVVLDLVIIPRDQRRHLGVKTLQIRIEAILGVAIATRVGSEA